MKHAAAALALSLLAAASTWAGTTPEIEITRGTSRLATTGPQEGFTGNVQVEPLFSAHAPARASASNVTFQPRSRSAWHTHPLDQTLIVTAGRGRGSGAAR
jgi:quercetin dioxygenase-like cupin family protein